MDCNAGPRKSVRGSEWEPSMVEICILAIWAAQQLHRFLRFKSIAIWPLQVVLPGGLLLPPPEVQFGVVGVWDIPDEAGCAAAVLLDEAFFKAQL